jgi:phosphatidylserine/phosphatidylglycerophosphate/cardiolipin synthase-like enzyme
VQVELRGPVVREVEAVFRERWEDPAALSRLPWQAIPDRLRGAVREPQDLPPSRPDPPAAGTCAVLLLRTYPNRWPGYRFAPDGERSAARAYAKALTRARRLVYVEDQYLWSTDIARVFADALRREPRLHLVVVVPRFPDQDGITLPPALLGHARALEEVENAGAGRVCVVDVENPVGVPVYVHAKVCVVDDTWGRRGLGQLQPPVVDPRLRARRGGARRDLRRPGAARPRGARRRGPCLRARPARAPVA